MAVLESRTSRDHTDNQGFVTRRSHPKKALYALNQYAEARGPAPISPGSTFPANCSFGSNVGPGGDMATFCRSWGVWFELGEDVCVSISGGKVVIRVEGW